MNPEQKNFLLKKEINILIDNIIKQEDELNKYLNTKDNQSLLIEISNNNQRIESLSNLIKKETNIAEEKTKKLEEEILGYQKKISKLTEPKVKYNQKDFEQNLIKEKFLLKTINLHENEINEIKENLMMLKEEKIMISNELIRLMSLRENYEDIIKMRAKYIFKIRKKNFLIKKNNINSLEDNENNYENLTTMKLDEDTNININDIKIEYKDILNIISINKLCNYIYKIIATNIVSNFSSLLIELNLKNVIFLCVENEFNKYIKNDPNISFNKIHNFIREISVNIVNYNIKFTNLFIEPQFEILLKCIFKLFSLEKEINDGLKFVNNDYTLMKELKEKISLKETEIKKINEELNLSINVYKEQIDKLEQENMNLDNKCKNNDFKYKIENINQQIDFLFKGIKSKIKEINDKNQKDKLIKDMIQDINNCLESKNNYNNTNTFNKNNFINIIDDMNIKRDFEDENYNDENNEDEEISENELLSSYNSASLNEQNPVKIYHKKKGNKSMKYNFNHEFGKENTSKKNNNKFNDINANLKRHHHYLKLSECFQLNDD